MNLLYNLITAARLLAEYVEESSEMINRASRIRGLVFVALLVMLAVPATLVAQSVAKVVEVAISGNQNINTDTINSGISLKVGDEYSEQAIEKDKAAIMALGYFSAVTVHKDDAPGGVKVTYEVTENPRIQDVKVVGSEPIDAQKVLDLMKTKPNQVLNTATLNQDIEAIQSFYGEQGYIAYVTEDIGVDAQTGVLTVPILVHKVESVDVSGNKKTKSMVITREMKTQAGVIFNYKTLRQDIMKVYGLDILEEVKTPQITPGTEVGLVKVTIPVTEKKTGNVSVGIGYSSRQKLVGQARLSENNFRGLGQGLNLTWEQGTTDEAVGGNSSYELGFYEPWIDKHHTSLNINGFNKLLYRFSSGFFNSGSVDDKVYNERHKGADLTLSRPLNDFTRVYVGGRFENVDTDPSLLTNDGSVSDLVNIVQTGDVIGGSLRVVHNTRDFDLDPAVGGYEALSLELGTVNATRYQDEDNNNVLEPLPFDGGFQKASVDARRYFSKQGAKATPQDKRTTIAVRLRAGYGNGTIPYFEQFFVGGSESLRGYREDRFWGDKMLLASVEYRKPIAQSVGGVLFFDYGDAWGTANEFKVPEFDQTNTFSGHYGTGVGLRVATPIGNLRLDYGIGDEGPRTHFSMGHAF
ncbi:MAG: POTRA domain-containing protein [Armatimonadota bacterium]|nr:BamA/TamA family outer membrane protein [bacterium]